jgi:hypothetical protein
MISAPLFRDPVFDGAADPVVVKRVGTEEWWMFYTARRTTDDSPGFAWLHGTRIGIAVSSDAGSSWSYRGVVEGLDETPGPHTHWAPEIIHDGVRYHMFLSYLKGVPDGTVGPEAAIIHFVSDDLLTWNRIGRIPTPSHRVIDACVYLTGKGLWRLWYKDELAGSATSLMTSTDAMNWTDQGVVIGGRPHEGPNVFDLGGWHWLITDEWRGQAVYRSDDLQNWHRQGLILEQPGRRLGDGPVGRHADVVTQTHPDAYGEHAVIFYFTHPWWNAEQDPASIEDRVTYIQAAVLRVTDGVLTCDRDEDATVSLR